MFVISVIATALLYALPVGRTLAWPLVLLSTLAHELGHGLAAVILGGRFESLVIYQDASGAALWSGSLGRVATAMVAAAGLVGPAATAFALLAVGRTPRSARIALTIVAAGLAIVTLLLVRNPFGMAFTTALAVSLIAVMVWAPRAAQGVIVFLAVQLALSVFSRSDYLFTTTAVTASGRAASDVAVMSGALLLPYWFWGALCGAVSIVLLAAGLKLFFRRG